VNVSLGDYCSVRHQTLVLSHDDFDEHLYGRPSVGAPLHPRGTVATEGRPRGDARTGLSP
jgi:hypothetical protein